MMIQISTIIALLLFHFVYAKEQTKEECGGQVASGSPFDSCGRFTLSGSEKCIPRNDKFSCEDVLKSVPEYLGFLTNVVARIMLCTCTKYEPWPSINAADHYTVTEIFKSDGGRLEGPTIVGSDLYWTGIADGIFKWSGRFSDDGGKITKIVDGSKDFGAHGMTFDNSTQTLVVTSVSQRCIYCPGVFRVDLSGENMKKISEGTPLHWPNDVTVSHDGTVYFTDPMFAPPRSRYHGLYSIRSNGDVVLEFDFKDIYRGIGLTSGPSKYFDLILLFLKKTFFSSHDNTTCACFLCNIDGLNLIKGEKYNYYYYLSNGIFTNAFI